MRGKHLPSMRRALVREVTLADLTVSKTIKSKLEWNMRLAAVSVQLYMCVTIYQTKTRNCQIYPLQNTLRKIWKRRNIYQRKFAVKLGRRFIVDSQAFVHQIRDDQSFQIETIRMASLAQYRPRFHNYLKQCS